ncbi:YbjP/YqhG family protein [Ralstonia solanacearum]|uniref:DUF3828 domain-containing protein n=1 Tax=Ralstonia solanacearum TaxID=305 RepID=UPI0005C7775A|nr:DUF3828 domain-containing protein [Ralstonia solanacearum]MBB6591526.1 DUF3828 domain-containing protein [Ralstonia solanacearum]MBB6595749.1 DUF3828 domain-containing protein [Ralstonia solanacearum]MDB0541972.1 YbjP/YqhG family protein [Ralstonia solanacearum]MDB0550488.1 YbjP/YqhG family protein [Ralstonia solanacearum]MDB0556874.1 YbjP/YqhG family protein [Ralstonia solanacearum]
MKKQISSALAWLALAFGLLGAQAAIAQNKATPDASTKAFYTWYIQQQAKATYPLTDDRIYTYVAKGTVDRLRDAYRLNKLPGDTDYFTKVQDYDEKDWGRHIAARRPIMLDDVAVVPVTFGSRDKISVVVFLKMQGGSWKVTKVEDTQDYP